MRRSDYEQPGVVLASRADAAARLDHLIDTVPLRLRSISDDEAAMPRVDGKWSAKQILGHLVDSAANNHHRFVRAQIQGSLDMPGYTQNEWVATQHYQEESWLNLTVLWTSYNRHMLHLMEKAPVENLNIVCTVAGDISGTLEFLMIDYVAHLEHHLNQIFATAP